MGGSLKHALDGTLPGAILSGAPWTGPGLGDVCLLALALFLTLKALRVILARGEARRRAKTRKSIPDPWQYGGDAAREAAGADIPGFDAEHFLRGAKTLFIRLQETWDTRDLDAVAPFISPPVFREIQAQATAAPKGAPTRILFLGATLASAGCDGDEAVVSVLFDALVREETAGETPDAEAPVEVRELWRFVRPAASLGASSDASLEAPDLAASWRLDGIEAIGLCNSTTQEEGRNE